VDNVPVFSIVAPVAVVDAVGVPVVAAAVAGATGAAVVPTAALPVCPIPTAGDCLFDDSLRGGPTLRWSSSKLWRLRDDCRRRSASEAKAPPRLRWWWWWPGAGLGEYSQSEKLIVPGANITFSWSPRGTNVVVFPSSQS